MPRHSETRHLPYSPEQMFDLVADVARYGEFLPWVVAVRVRSNSDVEMVADLVVGFKALREKFTSRVVKARPESIHVDYLEGPLSHLSNDWRFRPDGQGGCLVDFTVDFAFRSRIFEAIAGQMFDRAHDRRVRGTRRQALRGGRHQGVGRRQQEFERPQGRLKADAAAAEIAEILLVGDRMLLIVAFAGTREHDGADRLLLASAARAGNAGDGDSDIDAALDHRPARHRPGGGEADRAERLDHIARNPQQPRLGFVRIGDEAGIEDIRRAGYLGQRGADQAARAALGNRDAAANRTIFLDHAAGKIHQNGGKDGIGHLLSPGRRASAG
jgi:coenzyme Q-binding protein COQ10